MIVIRNYGFELLPKASWLVQTKNYSGSGALLDEIGSTNATAGAGANAPSWDGANDEFDYVRTGGPDYHTMGTGSILDFGAESFSVMIWCKCSDAATDYQMVFGNRHGATVGNGWHIRFMGATANDPVVFAIRDGSATQGVTIGNYAGDTYATWGGVFDFSTQTITGYKDGVAGTPVNVSQGSQASGYPALLGSGSTTDASWGFNGSIRAAVAFRGRALSQSEMAKLHFEVTS